MGIATFTMDCCAHGWNVRDFGIKKREKGNCVWLAIPARIDLSKKSKSIFYALTDTGKSRKRMFSTRMKSSQHLAGTR